MILSKALCTGVIALASIVTTVATAASPLDAYTATAQQITDGFTSRDTEPFDRSVAPKPILDKAFDGILVKPDWERGFRQGLTEAMKTRLGKRIISQIPNDAHTKLLRVKLSGQEGRALIRLDYGEQGNGYLDLHLRYGNSGDIQIVDWFDYSTGQLYSESLRQVVATMSPTPTIIGKVFDIATNKQEGAEVLQNLLALNREKRYPEMVKQFLSLDKRYRQSRLLNVITLQAANASNDMQLYHDMLDNIARYFSDDDTMVFMLIDYYFLEGDFDRVIAGADKLEQAFGTKDAALMIFKANAMIEQGRLEQAIEVASNATRLDPMYEYSYWSLLSAQLAAQQYQHATNTAQQLEELFQYDMGPNSLGNNDMYADFVASDAYKKWRSADK